MPRSGWACAPQLLSLRSTAREPQLLRPRATNTEARGPGARAPQQEKPPEREAHAPLAETKACAQQRRPNAAKNKLIN